MDVDKILQKIDTLFEANRGEEAEELMRAGITAAMEEGDDSSLLQLLNELLGYYRETSQVENSYAVAGQAVKLAERMGLQGTIPYATTLLNVANAYRAGGRLQESLQTYLQVRTIYDRKLAPDNLLTASLENNISLLYQEMGEFQHAKECLLKALLIVEAKQADFEIAVTNANLANTCLQLNELEEAFAYAQKGLKRFEKIGIQDDTHYGAILSALGNYYYRKNEYQKAVEYFQRALRIMEAHFGRTEYYHRLAESIETCKAAMEQENGLREIPKSEGKALSGLELCRLYYEEVCRPMLESSFPDYVQKIAVGLVGEGSDCFGFDDEISRDHDWGPELCLWITDETEAAIGRELRQAYAGLPAAFYGYKRTESSQGRGRRGVMTIGQFYQRLLGSASYEEIAWRNVEDAALAAAVNGQVFQDEEGIFSSIRKKLKAGYPEQIKYLKLAEGCAHFAQSGQYNYARCLKRGDSFTAELMLWEALKEAMKLQMLLEGRYPVHDKWLRRSMEDTPKGKQLGLLLKQVQDASQKNAEEKTTELEQIGTFLAQELYESNLISDTDAYLDAHTKELLLKADLSTLSDEELVDKIVKLEFEAFDKVKNEGGRASCQNDWPTFSIMRKSQYQTWNRTMLLQYLYDFNEEFHKGHNLIEEKYGRMMESTAPEKYQEIKEHFPVLSPEKKQIIEQITALQVGWMEEFAAKYPCLADNARSVHTSDDNAYNTSYETYLRGEISTYSDKMLELYGRYVVGYAVTGKNLTFAIMTNSVHLYGYEDLDSAEQFFEE